MFGLVGLAGAQCACSCGPLINNPTTLANILRGTGGNTVCVSNGSGGWTWQEQHRGIGTVTTGQLWDFKLGTNPMDPTEQVGTWTVSGTGGNTVVTHSYLGGSSFTYSVCQSGVNFGFCLVPSTVATISATVKTGIATGCP